MNTLFVNAQSSLCNVIAVAALDRSDRGGSLRLGESRYFLSYHATGFRLTTLQAFSGNPHAAQRHDILRGPGKSSSL